MEFCVECGHKNDNSEQNFCVNCGASLSGESRQGLDHDEAAPSNIESINIKSKMTKQQKKKWAIGSIILIVCMALYFIGSHFTSEMRLINKYSDAIREKDAAKLGEIVSFSSLDQTIGEENAKAFLSLLDDYPESRQEMIDELQEQANHFQGTAASEWMAEDYIVSLVKGKGFLFYDTYELITEPIYVTVHTNVEDAILFVDGEEVTTSDSTDFSHEHGPLTAGKYLFQAELDNEYVELEAVEEVTVNHWDNFESIYLNMDVTYIEFAVDSFEDLDARLIVNDEIVDFNLLEEDAFGPIISDETKIASEVDFPWGTMISEPDYPQQYYDLNFSLNKDMEAEVSQEIASYHKNYWEGWQGNNTSELDYLAEDLINRLETDFSYYHSDDYYTFERQSVLAEMDRQNIEVLYKDGYYTLFVNMMEEYKDGNYVDLSYRNLYDQVSYYQVELRYDEGWKVYNLDEIYHHTFDDPLKIEVSNKIYLINEDNQSDEGENKEDENLDSHAEIENATLDYVYYLVEAINTGDYEQVEPYIKEGSALHGMQKDLVDRLFKNGTTQEIVSASVEKINNIGTEWTVTTNETIKVIYESGTEETKSYVWNYTVESVGSEFALTNIEADE